MPRVKPGDSDEHERPGEPTDESGEPDAETAADEPEPSGAAAERDGGEPEPLMTELEDPRETARGRGDAERPKVVRVGFYLALAAVAFGLGGGIFLFAQRQAIIGDLVSPRNPNRVTLGDAQHVVDQVLWLYIIVVVVLGAFIALFAYKAQEGVRRARMMLLVVTLILLFFYLLSPILTSLSLLSGLLAAAMIVLMYLPSTRAFFGPRQTIR